MRASRVMLTCEKRTRVFVCVCVHTYVGRIARRFASESARVCFQDEWQPTRSRHSTNEHSCQVENIIRRILSRDPNLRDTRQSSFAIMKIESLSSYLYQYDIK